MILTKLYTQPTELFPTVKFRPGLNFIYGIKDKPDDTLNGIGKSVFLDFLDFALLSYFNHSANTRLNRAYRKNIISNHRVVLEFKIKNVPYKISRSFDDPDIAYFSKHNKQGEKYNIRDLRFELTKHVFGRKFYLGVIEESWYRNLIKFYLKIQKVADEKFTDPIRYINKKEILLNIFHLFLLNIDNSMLIENLYLNDEIENYRKTAKTTKQFLKDHYNISDISKAANTVIGLTNKINRLKKNIDEYKLDEEYDGMKTRLNAITQQIKNSLFLVTLDEKKIKDFENPAKLNSNIISSNVEAIYSELNTDFKNVLRKTIDEAKSFRNELEKSRADFVAYEKSRLQMFNIQRNREIEQLEKEQTQIFKELANKNALADLNTAHVSLNNLFNEKVDIESKIDFYKGLMQNINNLKNSDLDLLNQVDDFISTNSNYISSFASLLGSIYKNIFNTPLENEFFSISNNLARCSCVSMSF